MAHGQGLSARNACGDERLAPHRILILSPIVSNNPMTQHKGQPLIATMADTAAAAANTGALD
jgi:hypothetical protein